MSAVKDFNRESDLMIHDPAITPGCLQEEGPLIQEGSEIKCFTNLVGDMTTLLN